MEIFQIVLWTRWYRAYEELATLLGLHGVVAPTAINPDQTALAVTALERARVILAGELGAPQAAEAVRDWLTIGYMLRSGDARWRVILGREAALKGAIRTARAALDGS